MKWGGPEFSRSELVRFVQAVIVVGGSAAMLGYDGYAEGMRMLEWRIEEGSEAELALPSVPLAKG